MLTEEERREIEEELKRVPSKAAACYEALRIVQRKRGWISDEIRDIAQMLELTAEELDAIATFYPLIFQRPVGKHIIYVCDGVSCWIMDGESVGGHLRQRLGIGFGETTPDGQFTLLPVPCLGACDRAPVMMVDDELFGNLTAPQLDEILGRYR
jgi:NADH-quinone oxidoreductase subunit E